MQEKLLISKRPHSKINQQNLSASKSKRIQEKSFPSKSFIQRTDRSTIPETEFNKSVLKETNCSTLKKRKKFIEIKQNIAKHTKAMITFDKRARHYYIPNNSELSERNEFMYQMEYDKLKRENLEKNKTQSKYNPEINRISRDLANSSRIEDYPVEIDYEKDNENIIQTIGKKLELAIKQEDTENKGKLIYTEFCALLSNLRNKKSIAKFVIYEIANELWNFMQPKNDAIYNADIYDVLIILLGTRSLDHEITYKLFCEYLRKSNIYIEDYRIYFFHYRNY